MRFQLTPKGRNLADEFEQRWGDKECYCIDMDDGRWEAGLYCDYCLHPGNPINIQEDDSNITNILISKDDPYENS